MGFAHGQRAYNIGHGQLAFQREGAIISQYAAAWGHRGTSGVNQIALASGHQEQSAADAVIQVIPTPSMASQQQGLNLHLDQDVVKHGGIGGAFGVQGGIATQRQTLVTPNGVGTQVGFVGAVQFGFVGGARGSDASVIQSVDVTTTQHQSF